MIDLATADEERRALDYAFNLGSDARIYGYALEDNPYEPRTSEAGNWRDGWWYVHNCWGLDAHWPYPVLPDVLRVL